MLKQLIILKFHAIELGLGHGGQGVYLVLQPQDFISELLLVYLQLVLHDLLVPALLLNVLLQVLYRVLQGVGQSC